MLTELLGNASSGHSTNKSLLCNSAHVSSPLAATVETCHYLRQSFLGHLSLATSVFLTPHHLASLLCILRLEPSWLFSSFLRLVPNGQPPPHPLTTVSVLDSDLLSLHQNMSTAL